MHVTLRLPFVAFISLLAVSVAAGAAETVLPFLSPAVGEHMVLQRGKPHVFWGWTQPGSTVRVAMAEESASVQAAADGRWEARLAPLPAGGPYTVTVDGAEHVVLKDVLVGDVWLCGGQSNMQFDLAASRDGAAEVAAAAHPRIRLFSVKSRPAYRPVAAPTGEWKVCSPETAARFSAVAYFFAQEVQPRIDVPIGLVQDCLGGTPIECWTSEEALRSVGDFDAGLAEIARLRAEGAPEYGNYILHWYDRYDQGLRGTPWFEPALDDREWKPVKLPGGFAELGVPDTPSVCWFRRDIVLPDPLPAGKATLRLGVVEKMDTAYVNGRWVGASSWVENPRVYPIDPSVLKPGRNSVVLRILKLAPDGGFRSPAEGLQLVLGDKTVIPLAGEWKGRLSVDARPPHELPLGYENYPIMPAVLHRGMLAPLAPMEIRGALWYQGEANSSHARQYRKLLPLMIADWRRLFRDDDLPFYIVSLPAFMKRKAQPGNDAWAELREAQALTARAVPHTGLAVTIDTGDPDNIHPIDKKIVGQRLAYCALAGTYGFDVPSHGPEFESLDPVPHGLRVRFAHAKGLNARGGAPAEFAVAGRDHVWHAAQAVIDGDSVTVSSPDVAEPVAVRYAWQSNPVANLYNGDGLPAVPFRTDDWPGTEDARTDGRHRD